MRHAFQLVTKDFVKKDKQGEAKDKGKEERGGRKEKNTAIIPRKENYKRAPHASS